MAKKLIIIFPLLFSIILFSGAAEAQSDWLPDPGISPDSPFYFLDIWGEKIGMFFAFNFEAKVKKALSYSEERIAEANYLAEKGKTEKIEEIAENYREQIKFAEEKTKEAGEKGKDTKDALMQTAKAVSRHFGVFEGIIEKIPAKAGEAVAQAKEKSKSGYIQSLESLGEQNSEEALKMNINTVEERLEGAKAAAVERKTEKIREILEDYKDFGSYTEKLEKTDENLVKTINQARIKESGQLDELEKEAGKISVEIREEIGEIKSGFQEKFKESLENLAEKEPQEAMEINIEETGKKLGRIENRTGQLNEDEGECRTICTSACNEKEIEPCVFSCLGGAGCLEDDEECFKEAEEECQGACRLNDGQGECLSRCLGTCLQKTERDMEREIEEFQAQNKFGERISEIAQNLQKGTTTVEELVGQATSIHLEVLGKVYEKVSEESKPAIEEAIKSSVRVYEKSSIIVEERTVEQVQMQVEVMEKIPQVIREKVRQGVVEELGQEMKEIKEGLEIKSLKDELSGNSKKAPQESVQQSSGETGKAKMQEQIKRESIGE